MTRRKATPPPPAEFVAAHEEHRHPEVHKNLYRVIGPHAVHGAAPGEEIELSLTPGELASLIGAGHIAPVEVVAQERI